MYISLAMFIYHINTVTVMKKSAFFLLTILSLMVYSCENYATDLGGGYKLSYTGHNFRDPYNIDIISPDNKLLVHRTVLEYAYDSVFIIASQRPWNDSIIPPNNRHALDYDEKRRVFTKSTFRQYWIINKAEECKFLGNTRYTQNETISPRAIHSNVYGPFSLEEFLLKRKELGVSDSLVLKNKWKWPN